MPLNKSGDFKTLKRLVGLGLRYKRLFALCLFLAVALAPVSTIAPYLVKVMVDDYILNSNIAGLKWMVLLYFGVILLNVIMRYTFIYSISDLGQSVIKDLRTTVYSHLLRLNLKYFDRTPVGTSTTRTISDIQAINEVFTQGVITIVADLLAIITIVSLMFYTSWILTLISLAMLPVLLIATYIFKEKVKSSYSKVRNQLSNMNAFLQERISGMKIVQIFNAEEKEKNKFREINRKYTQANLESVLYYSVFFPVVELISAFALALMVWYGAGAYLKGHVSFGALVAFPMFLDLIFRPVRMAADKFNTLQMGLVAAERVFKILDNREIIPDNGTVIKPRLSGTIEFKNVYFGYDEKVPVLKDISFKVSAGETMAIVGSTGSGKSTIINILNRFYDIEKGEILIDQIPIKDFKIQNLRDRIAIVLQDVFLFYGSVFDNITLKDPTISMEDVIRCSKLIGAHEFLSELPGGYQYIVMERGNNLSVGQRQLISFVRALIKDPDILILDEATSSIDTKTEAVIQYAIEKLIEKRTSIIIAHRLSTIKHADKIMVIEKGEILELGHHDELMSIENGRYRELYELSKHNEHSILA